MSPNTQEIMGSSVFSRRRVLLWAAFGYILLTLLMFGDILLSSKDLVISGPGTDGFGQFLSWRKYGFDQMRQGNLPLWNPYVFSGAPYFGGFQAALLYPPNLIFLFLPVATAMNCTIVLHLFLAGYFLFLWLFYKKLHPVACFLAGVIWMFSGQYFYHIFAGHLPNLSAMVWAPLFFLTIDAVIEKPSRGWCLFGIFVLTMQILAGHPQYVYYTSLIGGLYGLFRFVEAPQKKKTILTFALIYVGAVALTSIQFFTGAQGTAESIRSLGLTTGVAGSFSFPPESFLTLFSPDFFGNMRSVPYWGRWNLWEMCLFCGVTGSAFAVYGAASRTDKQRKVIVLICLLCCLIAIGTGTQLFLLLYHFLPGFNKFRGTSKFHFLTTLFICLLAAMGIDDFLRRGRSVRGLIYGVLGFAVIVVVAGFWIRSSGADPNGSWKSLGKTILLSESSASPALLVKPEFVTQMAGASAKTLFFAAATAIVLAITLVCFQRWKRSIILIVVLTTAEMFLFAWSTRDSFNATDKLAAINKDMIQAPGDGRFDYSSAHNLPMFFGREDIWGNDPGIPLRYGQLMAQLQSVDQQFAAEFDIVSYHPFFKALRYRYAFIEKEGKQHLYERTNAMSELVLIGNYRVIDVRTNALKGVADRKFDPENEVILEKEPNPRPQAGKPVGNVKLTKKATDFLEVEGDLTTPAILLITDSYTPSWRAKALPGSSQTEYELLPADYCLRGVPLAAGHHKIRIEYAPSGFVIGRWISIVSLIAYLAVVAWHVRRGKKEPTAEVQSHAQVV